MRDLRRVVETVLMENPMLLRMLTILILSLQMKGITKGRGKTRRVGGKGSGEEEEGT